MTDTLPEGTDHIIPGAANNATREPPHEESSAPGGGGGASAAFDADGFRDTVADLRDRVAAKASETWSTYQVDDKAMKFAEGGKARASGALDEVARMIEDTATKIDEQVGGGYGAYARKAAEAVSGASSTLRDRSVDELLEDARLIIRKSPAIAVSAATVAGFALARILRAGSEIVDAAAKDADAKITKVTDGPSDVPAVNGRKGKANKSKSASDV